MVQCKPQAAKWHPTNEPPALTARGYSAAGAARDATDEGQTWFETKIVIKIKIKIKMCLPPNHNLNRNLNQKTVVLGDAN